MSALKQNPPISPQDIFASATAQATDLGACFTAGDGRVFRYALGSGTALVPGKVYQAVPQDTTNWQFLGVSVAAGTGTFAVTTGSSVTIAANLMAGGQLTVRSGTGQGYSYGIKSHPAATAGTLTFTLSDPIQVALPTTAVFDVTPNLYSGVVVAPTTLSGVPVGVAVYAVPASNYGFIQTRGICPVLSDSAVTVGKAATCSTGTAGALVAAAGSQTTFATAAVTTSGDKYMPFFLSFE